MPVKTIRELEREAEARNYCRMCGNTVPAGTYCIGCRDDEYGDAPGLAPQFPQQQPTEKKTK